MRHIWGDAPGCDTDDEVADTPLQDQASSGCPSSAESCGGPNMFQNYMDFTDDSCMNLFTEGQKIRMRSAIEVSHAGLLNPLCTPKILPPHCSDNIQNNGEVLIDCGGECRPCPPNCTDGIQNFGETGVDCGGRCKLSCTVFTSPITVTIQLDNYPNETYWEIRDLKSDSLLYETDATTKKGKNSNLLVSPPLLLSVGDYQYTIYDKYGDGICCQYGNGFYRVSDARNTTIASGSFFFRFAEHLFRIGEPKDNNNGSYNDHNYHNQDNYNNHNNHHNDDNYNNHHGNNNYNNDKDGHHGNNNYNNNHY